MTYPKGAQSPFDATPISDTARDIIFLSLFLSPFRPSPLSHPSHSYDYICDGEI